MLDYASKITEEIGNETGLPVYYELFADSDTPKPCITYLYNNNREVNNSDELSYQWVSYYIKIWGTIDDNVFDLLQPVDKAMKSLGFKKASYNELSNNTNICLVLLYDGLGQEYID